MFSTLVSSALFYQSMREIKAAEYTAESLIIKACKKE